MTSYRTLMEDAYILHMASDSARGANTDRLWSCVLDTSNKYRSFEPQAKTAAPLQLQRRCSQPQSRRRRPPLARKFAPSAPRTRPHTAWPHLQTQPRDWTHAGAVSAAPPSAPPAVSATGATPRPEPEPELELSKGVVRRIVKLDNGCCGLVNRA